MYWILPIALFSFLFLDHSIARSLYPLISIRWPLKLICLFFQPFIQLLIFSCAYCFLNQSHLYKQMILNSLFIIGVVTSLKVIIARARPHLTLEQGSSFKLYSFNFNYHSLPSSHAAASFAFFLTLSSAYPRLQTPLLLLALLICLSRMLLAQHFLSDCLVGAFIGVITPSLSQKIFHLVLSIKKG